MNSMTLIKNEEKVEEKRILPRFPFCFLTFKGKGSRVFEVVDISNEGMQISLKDGGHEYIDDEEISGNIHWKASELNIKGKVKWVAGHRVGVKFDSSEDFSKRVEDFLSTDNIIKGIIPLHSGRLDVEIPSNLRYWLRADGPVELFVWQHSDGELAKFQMIVMKEFVEWQDGKGVQTGIVKSHRDIELSMTSEDEFIFQFDGAVDTGKMNKIMKIVDKIPSKYLPTEARDFVSFKLQTRAC